MRNLTPLLPVFLASFTALQAAELKVAAPFGSHAILQRDTPLPVWGSANAGEKVTVSFAGQRQSATAGADGRWRVVLNPVPLGAKGTLVVEASSRLAFEDVQSGDVWICAGDSAMIRSLQSVRSARSALPAGETPDIRVFTVPTTPAKEPQTEVRGSWIGADRKSLGEAPALPYLLALELRAQTKGPVGIIQLADSQPVTIQRGGKVTGSTVEAWISEKTLQGIAVAKPIFDYYRSASELRDAMAEFETALGDWKLQTGKAFGAELRELENREPDVWYDYVAEMRKAGKAAPADPPRKPTAESLRLASTHAANLYNGMVTPLAGLAVRGVVLNLGMANAPRAHQFRTLFPALITDWRQAWGRQDLPFVFLQQSRATHPNMDPRAICELREAQAATAAVTGARMVRTLDLPGNLFPEDIPALAKRVASGAQAVTQNRAESTAGPIIDRVDFRENKAIVSLRPGSRALATRGGEALKGFALSERANLWAYAHASIEGDRIVVTHPEIKAPKALRYDWVLEAGYEGNLTDASGLPALPYRSDSSPGFTETPAALKPNAVATIQPTDLYPVLNPGLPRVLLIGDSIMNGYSPFVIEALRGKANVVRLVAFGMIGRKDADAAEFCAKLKDGNYALIHYNDGLHSLPPRITDEQFGVGLTAMLKHLKTVAPHVIWATTTPAPDRNNTLGPDSHNGTVITRNGMSQKIAAEFGVPVNDLYALVIDRRETLQGFANLHFTPEGSKLMGQQIARMVLEALERR